MSCLSISIVIPVHNGGESFRFCLSRISVFADVYEVIVVADGDTCASRVAAEEYGIKVLTIPVCGGPAQARNLGAMAATGDILFFIDADVTIKSDTTTRIIQAFEQEADLAAVIGSYDDEPGENNFLSQYKNLFHHYTHQTAKEEAFTFWGACGAIRRDIFLSLGGFDESYRRPSIEDIEFGYRLKKAGYKIRLCKDLQVKHLKRWTIFSLLKAEIFYRAIPWTELIWRERHLSNDLNLGLSSRLSLIFVYILLSSLLLSWWWNQFLILTSIFSLLLLVLNLSVYRFFFHKRGLLFTLGVIPWHWLYFFYGVLAFAFGTTKYWFNLLFVSGNNKLNQLK
jgi:GT2 family glycosyltransferase